MLHRLHHRPLLVESEIAPPGEPSSIAHGSRSKPLLLHIAPLLFIFTVIMGSMYFGFASPSESAAAGCLATMILALAFRALTFSILLDALRATVVVTTMLFMIIAASTIFAQILAISGATDSALNALQAFHLAAWPQCSQWWEFSSCSAASWSRLR